jgi:alkylation response protein AidB-like acyl-CoA dehydrogenase
VRVEEILTHLLTADATPPAPELPAWWDAVADVRERFDRPIERALALGLVAPTPGAAFVCGYRAALGAMVPSLGPHTRAALCATEDGGAHPAGIQTRLTASADAHRLDGTKRFVTGARDADTLLVLADRGTGDGGRRALALVVVDPRAEGVAFEDMPATPFVPDVAHCGVAFTATPVAPAAVLVGDGWNDFVKPFRTLEDVHVSAALTAWLLGALRRHGGPRALIERLCAHAATLHGLAGLRAGSAAGHVALAGAFAGLHAILEAMEPWWADAPDAVRAMWARDRRILTVARGAREQRLRRAWEALSPARGASVGGG